VPHHEPDTCENRPLDPGERAELEWLRSENALLRTERDILVRVATGFAEDADATLLRRRTPFGESWTDRYEETR
jgi:hypothetical protein